ncbi:hypothetical protein AK812_SmicGene27310 [Symbiodinium microadriaticum]|uniref:Uncharacterized protein n=1 Tax=Symbiodinium microadriaticum TaxID=2951 RepID=A0A1Q9D771_SYMMI|nr:hypothetical protein AK812_SmicGene27310 [Symbiodinium microadriaticum]
MFRTTALAISQWSTYQTLIRGAGGGGGGGGGRNGDGGGGGGCGGGARAAELETTKEALAASEVKLQAQSKEEAAEAKAKELESRFEAVGSLPELEPTPWDLAATNKIAAAIRQEEDYMAIRRPVAADVMAELQASKQATADLEVQLQEAKEKESAAAAKAIFSDVFLRLLFQAQELQSQLEAEARRTLASSGAEVGEASAAANATEAELRSAKEEVASLQSDVEVYRQKGDAASLQLAALQERCNASEVIQTEMEKAVEVRCK